MDYIKAFIVGGAICLIAQVILDRTKLTPCPYLGFICNSRSNPWWPWSYEPLVKFGGSGAKIPISGFGYTLAKEHWKEQGPKGYIGPCRED